MARAKKTSTKTNSNKYNPSQDFKNQAVKFYPKYFWSQLKMWWHKKLWHKLMLILLVLVFFASSVMWGVGQWYIFSQSGKPVYFGATFISDYAVRLGVDPKETLHATLNELGVKHLRLVSYWKHIEKNQGEYDFSGLDWQFRMAEEAGAKVSLAIGLRQPRWPECHEPAWLDKNNPELWYEQLNTFITKVVERYRSSSALESYQLENEFFLSVFGECFDFNRDRLVAEAELVKRLDPERPLIISRSNNALGLPVGDPRPDLFGVSIYKRVWDKTITKRYYEYPFPSWFYASLAGGGKILTGKDLIIHELQAEAWTPDGFDIVDAPVEELYQSMNPDRLVDRFEYAHQTGMKRIDLWGVEWWYQMKVKRGEPGLWDSAKIEFAKYNQQ